MNSRDLRSDAVTLSTEAIKSELAARHEAMRCGTHRRYTRMVRFESDFFGGECDCKRSSKSRFSRRLSAVCWRDSPPILRRFSSRDRLLDPCPCARARTHPTATSTSSSIDCAGSSAIQHWRAEIHRDPVWRRLRVGGGARHAERRRARRAPSIVIGPLRGLGHIGDFTWACPRLGRRTAAPARWPRGQDRARRDRRGHAASGIICRREAALGRRVAFCHHAGGLCAITLKTLPRATSFTSRAAAVFGRFIAGEGDVDRRSHR